MKFISSDVIINNVKTLLYTYDNSGLLLEDDFYRNIKWIITKLGISNYIESETILYVQNYKTVIPVDFGVLWSISTCNLCESKNIVREHYMKPHIYYVRDELKNICYNDSRCEIDRTITGTEYKKEISFTYEDKSYEKYCNRQLLKLKKGSSYCHNKCPNLKTHNINEFTISDNYFHFNFEEGYVHLQYYALPKDEDGYPIILDDDVVKQAIEDYLIYKSFQQLYYNNQGDVLQRMQYSEQKHQQSLKEAQIHLLTPSFNDLINFGDKLSKHFEIFELDDRTSLQRTSERTKFRY